MAADSLVARRAVREHLEANFDEYLSNVATYLRQAYPDLQLSNEVSEEIAATVIVRVSHANPEPTDIEKALCKSADDVVRSRRPRLSQARLLEEMNGPLRSEFPRALPSLRLVQSFGRGPAVNGDGETNSPGTFEPGTRLVLANPPVDLGASIGFGGVQTTEPEPGFSVKPSADVDPPASSRDLGVEGDDNLVDTPVIESGTLHEEEMVGSSRVESRHSNIEDAFFAEGDALDAALEDERAPLARDEAGPVVWPEAKLEKNVDQPDLGVVVKLSIEESLRVVADEDAFWNDDESGRTTSVRATDPPAVRPSRVPVAALDAFDSDDEDRASTSDHPDSSDGTVASGTSSGSAREDAMSVAQSPVAADAIAKAEQALGGVTVNEPQEGGALLFQQKLSSVPPTQESLVPQAISPLRPDAEPKPEKPSQPRTRRKSKASSKKASTKRRPAPSKSTPKRSSPKRTAAPARERAAPATSGGFVADDLAVLAMLGFPSNPKRAAMLCVTAVSEELGLDSHVDLTPFVVQVVAALDELRNKLERTAPMPPDSHLQWQRVARQATLRAFLSVGK